MDLTLPHVGNEAFQTLLWETNRTTVMRGTKNGQPANPKENSVYPS